jgi:polysaccharide pyruvyl transferase WcaK-like protein
VNNTGAEARTSEALKQIREVTKGKMLFDIISFDRLKLMRYMQEDSDIKIVTPNHIFIIDIIKLIIKSDMVILIEGSGFRQNFSSALLWYFLYTMGLAQELGIVTVAYAVDAGKLSCSNRFLTKKVAERIDLLMIRTEQAAQYLYNIGVRKDIYIHADTAFTLPGKNDVYWIKSLFEQKGLDPYKPVFGIAFKEFFWFPIDTDIIRFLRREKKHNFSSIYYHSWDEEREQKSLQFKKMIAGLLDMIKERYNANIILIAMEHMDTTPAEDVANLMKSPAPVFSSDEYQANEMASILRSLNFLITTRYHALVLSMAAGVPVIAISHDERLESIMEELGLKEEYYFEYNRLDPAELLPKLLSAAEKAVSQSEQISSSIKSAFPLFVARMEQNRVRFSTFLRERYPFIWGQGL